MPTYEIQANGKTFEVDAPDEQTAAAHAKLFAARDSMTAAATSGAATREAAAAQADQDKLSPAQQVAKARLAQTPNVPAQAVPAALGLVAAPAVLGAAASGASALRYVTPVLKSFGGEEIGRRLGGLVGYPEAGAILGGIVAGSGAWRSAGKVAAEEAPAAARTLGALAKTAAPEATETAAPVVAKAAAAVPKNLTIPSTLGEMATAVPRSQAMREFAQKELGEAAKKGQKVWMELDGAGNPTRLLTPNQPARAGYIKDMIRANWVN